MNKKEQIKKLTWKYFWQQKITEVTLFLLIASAIIFIPYLLGHNIGNNAVCVHYYEDSWIGGAVDEEALPFEVSNNECNQLGGHLEYFGVMPQWFEGVGWIILIAMVMFFFFFTGELIYELIKDWLKANWKKASKRARRELK